MARAATFVRRQTLTVLFAVLTLLNFAVVTHAYSVRYAAKTSPQGVMNFETVGFCGHGDSAHTMMPKLQSYQQAAFEVLTANGFSSAPIGGEARQAACLDANCTWQFNHGLFYHNELTFFEGVVFEGTLRGGPVPVVFSNFAPNQPQWWSNVSYWGARQPVMRNNGQWANDNVVTYFTEWVCEYYEYHASDAAIFPTYPNGDVIVPQSDSVYYHCGQLVQQDSQGRWIYQRCHNPFPWWAALAIAVVAFIFLFAGIIVVCCCCFYCERRKLHAEQVRRLEGRKDNPAEVPTQTQLGLGRGKDRFSRTSSFSEASQTDAGSP